MVVVMVVVMVGIVIFILNLITIIVLTRYCKVDKKGVARGSQFG